MLLSSVVPKYGIIGHNPLRLRGSNIPEELICQYVCTSRKHLTRTAGAFNVVIQSVGVFTFEVFQIEFMLS